jgi:ABC-type Mn2+/Zn2+ transport system ATPase subunit
MIESIEFTNFKALRKTTLPLAPFTLLLGPNGSGKSTVLQALQGVAAVVAAAEANHYSDGGMPWASLLSGLAMQPSFSRSFPCRMGGCVAGRGDSLAVQRGLFRIIGKTAGCHFGTSLEFAEKSEP